jgi:hypothetical protein
MKYFLLAASLAFVACGGSSDDESSERDSNDTVGAEIAEDYNRQMDKAKDIERQLQEQQKKLDDAVEGVEEDDDGVKG